MTFSHGRHGGTGALAFAAAGPLHLAGGTVLVQGAAQCRLPATCRGVGPRTGHQLRAEGRSRPRDVQQVAGRGAPKAR